MAKNGVFKKITALAMAIALVVCFAVSASAVTVTTTTTYVDGEDVKVNVTVTGVDEGKNVTYYATNATGDVHIDQEKATAAGASFEFNTDADNLNTATAKVGVTGASEATEEGGDIEGYVVTLPGGATKKLAQVNDTTVEFTWSPDEGNEFNGVTITGNATGSGTYENGKVTVVFSSITGDATVAVNQKTSVTITATADVLEKGAVIATSKVDGATDDEGNDVKDEVKANVGDVKLTVIGKATNASKYGILVSKETITGYDANIAYEGQTIATADVENDVENFAKGVFAVQIIDTSKTGALLEAGATYNVAVYAYDATAAQYVISASQTVEIPAASN